MNFKVYLISFIIICISVCTTSAFTNGISFGGNNNGGKKLTIPTTPPFNPRPKPNPYY